MPRMTRKRRQAAAAAVVRKKRQRARLEAAGGAILQVRLSPKAAAALERLTAGVMSKSDVVCRALIESDWLGMQAEEFPKD